MIDQTIVKKPAKPRGRPRIPRNYSQGASIILQALNRAREQQGLSAQTKTFLACFATARDAAQALEDYSKIKVSSSLLEQAAKGEIKKSPKLRKAMGIKADDRIRIRPECDIAEAHQILAAIASIPALEDYRERLRRQAAKAEKG